jgi:hypothetical protein
MCMRGQTRVAGILFAGAVLAATVGVAACGTERATTPVRQVTLSPTPGGAPAAAPASTPAPAASPAPHGSLQPVPMPSVSPSFRSCYGGGYPPPQPPAKLVPCPGD